MAASSRSTFDWVVAELKERVSSVTVYGSIHKLRRTVQLIAPDRDLGWLIEIERDLASEMQPRSKWDRLVLTEVLIEAGLTLIAEAESAGVLEVGRWIIRDSLIARASLYAREPIRDARPVFPEPVKPETVSTRDIGRDFGIRQRIGVGCQPFGAPTRSLRVGVLMVSLRSRIAARSRASCPISAASSRICCQVLCCQPPREQLTLARIGARTSISGTSSASCAQENEGSERQEQEKCDNVNVDPHIQRLTKQLTGLI